MKAADVMTQNVIAVSPDDLVQDVAGILLKHRISAAPVIDGSGKLVGIVSEGDLVHRAEAGTEKRRSWWLQILAGKETLAAEYVKSHARRVADIMSRAVVTVKPDTSLQDVASLLDKHHIKRVPVVEGGKVVGIVSRANLVQAFASIHTISTSGSVDDAGLRERIIKELKTLKWSNPSSLNIVVSGGVVELWGAVESEAEHTAVRIATENTPGVLMVQDNLTVGRLPGSAV